MRRRLRAATNEVHERLHGHDGFAAAASGTISTEDYRDLLARLYGFHAAFDDAMERAPSDLARDIELPARARDVLLALDLLGLGVEAEMLSRLPRPTLAPLSGEGEHLVIIARALGGFGENRRFYLGHGADHGRLWRVFLARLDSLEGEAADAAERAAAQVFSAFDTWMANWRGGLARVREETA
jgi:heme oxygenase